MDYYGGNNGFQLWWKLTPIFYDKITKIDLKKLQMVNKPELENEKGIDIIREIEFLNESNKILHKACFSLCTMSSNNINLKHYKNFMETDCGIFALKDLKRSIPLKIHSTKNANPNAII